ncbi:MAG: MBL fold metallo-hydrolase, partial [Gemmatimonadaceae bacterium]
DEGHTVAALIRDASTGATCAFVPGCGGIAPKLLARLSEADLLLFDGTFWTNDELIRLEISDRPALSMGHVPIAGAEGSLSML